MTPDLDLPEAVRRRALATKAGRDWLVSLPSLVNILEREWGMDVSTVLAGGSEALVAEATGRDGAEAVLKIVIPEQETGESERRCLLCADGRGYARVLNHDDARNAMLLEKLGPRLSQSGLSPDQQLDIICRTLLDAWRDVPSETNFMSGDEKADSLASFIRETNARLEFALDPHIMDTALRFAREREAAFSLDHAVLAHGDCHPDNTLIVPGDDPPTCKFIDPDGLIIERAYDLGILMREWSDDLLAGDPLSLGVQRCTRLSSRTGVELKAIWQWGFVERVSTGLLLRHLNMDDAAEPILEVARAWAADPDPF